MNKFKVGDRVRGLRGDIMGCEGIIEERKGRWILRFTKVGTLEWHGKGTYVVGKTDDRDWWTGGYVELITSPQYTKITPKEGEKYRVVKYPKVWHGEIVEELGCITIRQDERGVVHNKRWYVMHKDCFTTEYLELVEEPKGRILGKGMIESLESAQEWVNMWQAEVERQMMGTPFRPMIFQDLEPEESLITKTKKYMTNIYRQARMSAEEKVLYKAGYINEDGTPTSKGQEANAFITFQANQKELVKMAQAEIDEEKD